LAISLTDENDWQQFVSLLPSDAWPNLETLQQLTPEDLPELDTKISHWTQHYDRYELMTLLQDKGIAAGVVQDIADTFDRDPQLKQRDYLTELEHPIIGKFGHQAPPVKLSRTPAQVKLAPALGQHTLDICKRIIGLNQEQIQSLQDDKLFE